MIKQLPVHEEQDLIARTKSGDSEAAEVLLKQYEPAMRAAASSRNGFLDKDETSSATHSAFMEAIHAFNPSKHTRLSAVIKNYLKIELSYENSTAKSLSIPDRTLKRFAQIYNAANRDVTLAAEIAPGNEMTSTTFLHIHNIIYGSTHLPEPDYETDTISRVINTADKTSGRRTEFIKIILEEQGNETDLSPEELNVILTHYGFIGNANVKDYKETAYELGIDKNTVKAHHSSALKKARIRLSNINQ